MDEFWLKFEIWMSSGWFLGWFLVEFGFSVGFWLNLGFGICLDSGRVSAREETPFGKQTRYDGSGSCHRRGSSQRGGVFLSFEAL